MGVSSKLGTATSVLDVIYKLATIVLTVAMVDIALSCVSLRSHLKNSHLDLDKLDDLPRFGKDLQTISRKWEPKMDNVTSTLEKIARMKIASAEHSPLKAILADGM